MVHIDSTITGRFYTMNPATEDVIRGSKLEEGMVVLIEDSILKGDPERAFKNDPSGFGTKRVLEVNRWCKVTDLEVENDIVSFIGLYHDGTKQERRYNQSYCWIVKRDSLSHDEAPLKDWERELLDPEVAEYFEEYVPNNELVRRQVRVLRRQAEIKRMLHSNRAAMWIDDSKSLKLATQLEAAANLLEVHGNLGISLENFGAVGTFVNNMLEDNALPPFEPNNA